MRLLDVDIRRPAPLLPFFPLVTPANTLVSLLQHLMKASVLADSSIYFIFSAASLHSSYVYRCELSRCYNLHYFLTLFIISSFQNFLILIPGNIIVLYILIFKFLRDDFLYYFTIKYDNIPDMGVLCHYEMLTRH